MITKEQFLRVLEERRKFEKKIDQLEEIYNGAYLSESDLIEIPHYWFDMIWETNFSTEGVDWINWYIFDKKDGLFTAKYADGEEVPMDTDEDLWNFVKNYSI